MVYYNPLYNWVGHHPLYNLTNQSYFSLLNYLHGILQKVISQMKFMMDLACWHFKIC